MNGSQKKRSLPPKVAQMRERKRQKLEGKVAAVETAKTPVAKPQSTSRVNELAWREVSPPDQLDNYEGFFGLEEIDDVEIVRESDTGKVSFKSGKKAPAVKVRPEETNGGKHSEPFADEWDGFDEDPDNAELDGKHANVASESVHSAKSILKKNDVPLESKKKNTKTKKSDLKPQTHGKATTGNAFDILGSSDDEQRDDVDLSAWKKLSLSPDTMAGLARLRFQNPTRIQSSTIPLIMSGDDLIGKAPTGSGKTLAFGIPIFEQWLSLRSTQKTQDEKSPIALIIEPTRELAHQIEDHLKAFWSSKNEPGPYIATLTGGLSIQKQRRLLATADVVVATPGRLWEVVSDGHGVLAKMQSTSMLILDEADRLLSQGHFKELEQLLDALDRSIVDGDPEQNRKRSKSTKKPGNKVNRQTLVFSATFAKELQQKLSKQSRSYKTGNSDDSMAYLLQKLQFRQQPKYIDVNPDVQMAAKLHEGLLEVPQGTDKDLYLYALLLMHRPHPQTRAMVFANSIPAVRRLVPFLQQLGMAAFPLHSQMIQKARLRSIERFTSSTTQAKDASKSTGLSILVATDVAARGLDIPNVHMVIHYNVPRAADMYVHRSGRTARAEASGVSILICGPTEAAGVRRLVAQVHAKAKGQSKSKGLQLTELDSVVVSRLKPRTQLAKKIADAEQAKEKKAGADNWMREAAEDLGVELNSEESDMEQNDGNVKGGRGRQRREKEAEARSTSKGELREAKAQLRELLSHRVNTGVSERYITSGNVDIAALLEQRERGETGIGGGFLGKVERGITIQ